MLNGFSGCDICVWLPFSTLVYVYETEEKDEIWPFNVFTWLLHTLRYVPAYFCELLQNTILSACLVWGFVVLFWWYITMPSLTTECYCIFWRSCNPENASTEAKQTLEILHMVLAVTQGPMDQQALMNLNTFLWTPFFIPLPPLERIHSHHTKESNVGHTYEGIQETKSPFTYKNNAGSHGPEV